MKIDVLNIKGEKVEQITLNDAVFGIEPNDMVLAQYLRVYLANQRQGTSSTKDRSEVSGSGRKPWKQKGTGRARVGSIRSPLWRHGGITHGPKPKDWSLSLNKKMRKLAIMSALSKKFADKKAIILDSLNMGEAKTKEMLTILNNINATTKSLLVLNGVDKNILKSGSNVKTLNIEQVSVLNAYDILNAKTLILVKDAALYLEDKYLGKTKGVDNETK